MYLTGIFNIPAASTGIVKVIFADISIITFYFQCLQFNPKIFCRPKSNVLYKVLVCKLLLQLLFLVRVIQYIETFRKKTKSKFGCFSDHRTIKF